jgi:hypothetical protein
MIALSLVRNRTGFEREPRPGLGSVGSRTYGATGALTGGGQIGCDYHMHRLVVLEQQQRVRSSAAPNGCSCGTGSGFLSINYVVGSHVGKLTDTFRCPTDCGVEVRLDIQLVVSLVASILS